MKYVTTALSDIPWIRHGFFMRTGGESADLYATLNCAFGSNDDIERVYKNRAKVAAALGVVPENLINLYQHHSADVVTAIKPWTREEMPKGDGLVTATAGLAVGVLTADCAPVLFASKKDKVVAAAHAGWRGAVDGVLEATIAGMNAQGVKTSDIVAAIGPCIGPASYEVSDDFKTPFLVQDAANEKFFRAAGKPGHLMFDLPGYVAQRLRGAGIETVYETGEDTLADEEKYFSYRRSCQRKEPDYGRQMSVIAIV